MRRDIHVTVLVLALAAIAVAIANFPKSTSVVVNKGVVGNAVAYVPPESSARPDGSTPSLPPRFGVTVTDPPRVDQAGLNLIEYFEGFLSCPYWDAYGGVWTIGYGYTIGVTRYTPCESRAQAQEQLRAVLATRFEWAINSLHVNFNVHQRDALASFIWNTGPGTILRGTPIGNDLIARYFYAATRVMLEYDHAGGVVLEGLRHRREAEVRLFLTPVTVTPAERAAKRRHALTVAIGVLAHKEAGHHCGTTRSRKVKGWCHGWQHQKQALQRRLA